MDVHTRRLRHFVTVAETLHFSRAADILYLSQQGLSRSISQLEKDLGITLLERSTRSVVLTEAGEEFLFAAQRCLQDLDSGIRNARQVAERRATVLKIGVTVAGASDLMAQSIERFKDRHPDVIVKVENYGWSNPSCGLRSGETDVACLRVPVDVDNLRIETLQVEPRVIAVAAGHPLARESGPVKLMDLSGQTVTAPLTDDASWRAFWTLRDAAFDPDLLPEIGVAVPSLEGEINATREGEAFTVTVPSVVQLFPSQGIVFRPIEDVPGSRLVLGWRGHGTSLTEEFRSIVKEIMEEGEGATRR